MDIEELDRRLGSFEDSLSTEDRELLAARLRALMSVFPFNEYEYALMFLLHRGVIQFRQYEDLRSSYVCANKHLGLYELAPRIFGEIWAHDQLKLSDSRFVRPDRTLDPDYEGQYDLWIDGVRVEVKAARAIHTKRRASLVSKALAYDSPKPFWMNYQQIKLDICDVFIFIGVWVDRVVYWVLSNEEVKRNEYLSHQHRGGIEYQIGITHKNIRGFDELVVPSSELAETVIEKAGGRFR